MARDRISTSKQYQAILGDLKNNDVLNLGLVENKEFFMLTVALGLSNPMALENRDGFILNSYLKTSDKALMASVLLGTIPDGEDVDKYADFDQYCESCEKCAENGYQILQKMYNDADCDNEILERRMLKDLELLYAKNVDNI